MRFFKRGGKKAKGRGRDQEFEEVALPHMNALYGLALRMTRNSSDAEDLVQETFIRAYRFFDRFQEGTNCRAWLFKILYHTYINLYRKKKRNLETMSLDEVESYLPYLSSAGESANPNPEEGLLRKRTAEEVRKALEELPEEFRIAVILSDMEELSYKEIAEVMECPIGTVMSRLYRGRKLLRKILIKRIIRRDGFL